MAFMTRRPPSLIALGDAELQPFLQRRFLQSLVLDFNNLHLNDLEDPNYRDAGGHDDGVSPSTSLRDEILTTFYTSAGVSSGTGTASSRHVEGSSLTLAPTASFLASGMTESAAHQASDPDIPSTSPTTAITTNQNLPFLRPRDRPSSSLNIQPSRRVAFVAALQNRPRTAASRRCRHKGWPLSKTKSSSVSGSLVIDLCSIQKTTRIPCKPFQTRIHGSSLRRSHVYPSGQFPI